jgi:hypothetical protein
VDCRETLTELEAHLHKLQEDHKNKQLALSLDLRYIHRSRSLTFLHLAQIQIQIVILVHTCKTLVKNDSFYSKIMVLDFTLTWVRIITVRYGTGMGGVLGRGEGGGGYENGRRD